MAIADPSTVALLSGVGVPLVVALVAKRRASKGVKAALNLGLSVAAGGVSASVANGDVRPSAFVAGVAQTWVVSIASYYGLWKPAGVAPRLAEATAEVGVGQAIHERLTTETIDRPGFLTEGDVTMLRLLMGRVAVAERDAGVAVLRADERRAADG